MYMYVVFIKLENTFGHRPQIWPEPEPTTILASRLLRRGEPLLCTWLFLCYRLCYNAINHNT